MSPRFNDPQDFPMADGPVRTPIKLRKKKKHKIHHRPKSSIVSGSAKSEINVTPLVDVVLVLLIIFMVITPMLHRGVKIELPETVHHAQRQDTGEQLIVSVRDDGIYIDTDRVGDTPTVGKDAHPASDAQNEALVARLKKELREGSRAAFVRADKKLSYGQARYVLEELHAAGASTVSMQTEGQK
jgi:biopolymer transport protein ExbD